MSTRNNSSITDALGRAVSRRTFFLGAGAVGAATFLAACGAGGASTGPAGAESGPPRRGGTYIVGSTQVPLHANPAVGGGTGPTMIGNQAFAGLVLTADDFTAMPYLAESWEISPDELTATFKIRTDATFHDGTPITSADVAFSILAAKHYHSFKAMFEKVTAVETPDPSTVVIRLSSPHAALLACLTPSTTPILPKHIYDDGQDLARHPRNSKDIVGSGPFTVTTFNPQTEVRLDRYENFFLPGLPYADTVIFRINPSGDTMSMQLQQGEIHAFGSYDSITLAELRARPDIVTVSEKGFEAMAGVGFILFNVQNPYLSNIDVRRAIAHALDRDYIVDQVLGGEFAHCQSIFPPSIDFYSDDVTKYSYDVDKAKALLASAGHADGFTLRIDPLPGAKEFAGNMSEYIKQALGAIGITVEIRSAPDLATTAQRITSRDFDVYVSPFLTYGDPMLGMHHMYHSRSIGSAFPANVSHYSNPEVDELLDRASSTTDRIERKAVYALLQQKLSDELPVIPLAEYRSRSVNLTAVAHNSGQGVWGLVGPFHETWVTQ